MDKMMNETENKERFTTWFKLGTAKCCICSKTMPRKAMKHVPKGGEILRKWLRLLDGTFLKNWINAQSPKMVCKSHFICTHDGQVMPGALPRNEEYTHFMEKPKPPEPVEPIIVDNLSWDVYGLHSYSNRSRFINTGRYSKGNHEIPMVTCCICTNSKQIFNMMYVPTDEKTLKLWSDLLGELFSKNLKNIPSSQMVCKSHFICTHEGKVMAGALPRAEDYHHIMEKPKSWKPIKPITPIKPTILDVKSFDVYALHSYSRISKIINFGPYVDDSKKRNSMISESINREVNGEKSE